jgi:chemotaxis protein methyltransferase CheR
MAVLLSPGYRCRHVVFPAAAPRRALNVGRATAAGGAPGASSTPAMPPNADSPDRAGHPADDDDAFVTWLFSRAGLDARAYRRECLRRRVPACLRTLRAKSIADARRLVWCNPGLVPAAVGTMLIGVTSFFRDPAVFGPLGRDLLPALAAPGRPLRVWSAACSDGAELYSVAMLLAESNLLHRCTLLGTDCRREAVARAAAGVYDDAACRSVPPDLLGRYLESVGPDRPPGSADDGPAVGPPARRVRLWLRDAATWRCADMLHAPEPGPWDLVLCRNLAMYLRPAAAARLWRGLARVVRPGGLLVVGRAERVSGAAAAAGRFAPAGPCVYRRGDAP